MDIQERKAKAEAGSVVSQGILGISYLYGVDVPKENSLSRTGKGSRVSHRRGTVGLVFHVHVSIKILLAVRRDLSNCVNRERVVCQQDQDVADPRRNAFDHVAPPS
jgi:hypothetical protein